ncbi:MAG: EscU/YscU/HrcU family type III secretion system export apparatus switch protein [Chlamydiae bacterium]|nr:EscU/YscU/HrcU family type III secretion system export apparatus switch protein [Chlamydiota bacterium]
MAEKSEKATPKKLRDARKKGQVAKSQDFPSAFTFIVSISTILYSAKSIYETLAAYTIYTFKSINSELDMQNASAPFLASALDAILGISLPILGIVVSTGVLVNFLLIGPVFSVEVFKPDLKKLNPVTNLKNIFKAKTFFELLKSLFKITGAFILIYSVINDSLPEIVSTINMPAMGAVLVFASFLGKVVLRVGIFFLIVALFDLIFQKYNFAKEMRMEKYEVKQEYKDTEGDPHIKGRRRQIAREIAYSEGPNATRRARAVITNPTHIAVAIEYDAVEKNVPLIATMGTDLVAEEIIKIAVECEIPIMRNIELAQDLWSKGEIGEFIPEHTYQAVADILKWVNSLKKAKEDKLTELFK